MFIEKIENIEGTLECDTNEKINYFVHPQFLSYIIAQDSFLIDFQSTNNLIFHIKAENEQDQLIYNVNIESDLVHAQIKQYDIPKELYNIADLNILVKYLSESYFQLALLSNGDVKLYIKQAILGGGPKAKQQASSSSASSSNAHEQKTNEQVLIEDLESEFNLLESKFNKLQQRYEKDVEKLETIFVELGTLIKTLVGKSQEVTLENTKNLFASLDQVYQKVNNDEIKEFIKNLAEDFLPAINEVLLFDEVNGSITPSTVGQNYFIQLDYPQEQIRQLSNNIEALLERHDKEILDFTEDLAQLSQDQGQASSSIISREISKNIKENWSQIDKKSNLKQNLKEFLNTIETQEEDLKKLQIEIQQFQYQECSKLREERLDLQRIHVVRFTMNFENLSDLALPGSLITKQFLHPLEQLLFVQAFQYLRDKQSLEEAFEQNLYSPNAILVDFFVREEVKGPRSDKYKIKTDISGLPEIHTIVLCKIFDQEYKIIDPSNLQHSCFLPNAIEDSLENIGNVNLSLLDTHNLTEQESWLYKTHGKPTGYSHNFCLVHLFRDCTDIAVKLAFELFENQRNFRSSANNFEEFLDKVVDRTISKISNCQPRSKIYTIENKELFNENFVCRELQSTKQNERDYTFQLLENFGKLSHEFKTFDKNQLNKPPKFQSFRRFSELLRNKPHLKQLYNL